jgi:hypothetical protein
MIMIQGFQRSMLSDFEYKHPVTMLHLMESKKRLSSITLAQKFLNPFNPVKSVAILAVGTSARYACSVTHLAYRIYLL